MTALLYESIYVLASGTAFVSLAATGWIGGGTGFLLFILQLAFVLILLFFKHAGWTGRVVLISMCIAIIIAGFLLAKNESVSKFFIQNKNCLWILLTGPVAFIIGELIQRFRLIRIVITSVVTGWMIIGTILGFTIEKIFVCSAVILILFTLAEEVQLHWEKQGDKDHRGHLIYVSPFLIFMVVIVLISPAPEEPYDWGFFKKAGEMIGSIGEKVLDLLQVDFSGFDEPDPGEAVMGFSEKGEFAGMIRSSDRKVMTVSGLSGAVGQLRLTGKTFTDFDGKEWTDNDESVKRTVLMDTISMWSSLQKYTEKENDFVRRSTVNIHYAKTRSEHAFLPNKTVSTYADLKPNDYRDEGGYILWPEAPLPESKYTISYFVLNTDHPVFDDYLTQACVPSEKEYMDAWYMLNIDRLDGCDYNDYLSYMRHIKETYREAPVLSDKLRSYMDQVYEGAKTDLEKLQRLETMLRGFTYTLSPGPVPDSVRNASDFLDWFVLDSRQGFCCHFATAFVLLARAEGIAARYVQGYLTDTGGKRSAYVRSADAHAWPEVYFDGAGWITFEPTPASNERDSYWTASSDQQIESVGPDNIASPSVYEGNDSGKDLPDTSIEDPAGIRWYVIPISIAVGILFVMIALLIGHLIRVGKLAKMEEEERFAAMVMQLLRILRLSGFEMKENETLYEYRERLREEEMEVGTFLEEYEKYLYKNELAGGACSRARTTKDSLLHHLRKKSIKKYLRYYLGWK